MKQQPDLEQWHELSDKQKIKFWHKEDCRFDRIIVKCKTPIIGDLIEFLGDKWQFIVCYHSSFGDIALRPDNLCDALWESVSYKLSTG